jgi:succinate dehydrogenase / fumarate reductase flavoprotein subunit
VPKQAGDTRPPLTIPESERWYFLEEKYPRYGNLVPRDVASRELHHVCVDLRMGVAGKLEVYLDLTHIPRKELDHKLGGILEIYDKFVGEDPRDVPMRIYPAVHYSMGGLWVDYERTADGFLDLASPKNQSTNVPGLYAAGECEYQYHGANRLGANSLLSCIYGGQVGGPACVIHARGQKQRAADLPASPFEAAERLWADRFTALAKRDGPENPYGLWEEMGQVMLENVTIVRHNDRLRATDAKLLELAERAKHTSALDSGAWSNQPLSFLNQLDNMLHLARVVTLGALARDESRGSHYKPEFPKRDDEKWLKTTVATAGPDGPAFRYDPVDITQVRPVERKYD